MWDPNTMNALHTWIGPSTWGPSHPIDDGRFYDFVLAVWHEIGTLWNEAEAREIMTKEAKELHPDYPDEYRSECVERYRSRATSILDFLTHVKDEHKKSL